MPETLLFVQAENMSRKIAIEKTKKKFLAFIGLNFISLLKRFADAKSICNSIKEFRLCWS